MSEVEEIKKALRQICSILRVLLLVFVDADRKSIPMENMLFMLEKAEGILRRIEVRDE